MFTQNFPPLLLKLTINGENKFFLYAEDNKFTAKDIHTLAQGLQDGSIEKDLGFIKSWLYSNSVRQSTGHTIHNIDVSELPQKVLGRVNVETWADEFFHIHITKRGSVIVGYNKTNTRHIRYRIASFEKLLSKLAL